MDDLRSPDASSNLAGLMKIRQSRSPLLFKSPKATLTPTSKRLLLHPASTTIRESLTELASTTTKQLESIWDEVGYTPEERAGQIAELLNTMKSLCNEKIAEEQGVVEQFKNAIADAREELQVTCAALKKDFGLDILQPQDYQSLTDELAALEAELENVRTTADIAKQELAETKDKLINIHNALGSKLPTEWEDITSDLTQSRREAFHSQLLEMEEIEKTRTKAVIQLLLDCQNLLRELKLVPSGSNDFQNQDQSSVTSEISNHEALDVQIMGSLIESESDSYTIQSPMASSTNTGISASVLDKLTKRLAELSQEKKRRKKYLGELGQGIAALWEKLRVTEEEQRAFSDSVKGLGMDTIEKGEQELKRLTELKAQMMGNLIKEARDRIKELCEETHTDQSQLNAFDPGKVNDESLFTDDLLSEHEDYIRILQEKADQMRPLLKFIEKREIIIKERMEYEELQKDSERLQQRGAELTKQLMKEEKMAKRIKKDLPKYSELLTKRLTEWANDHGEPFLYQGSVYLELMQKQEEDWQAYKNHEMQMKLRKKQKGMASDKNISGKSHFKPLPGKKRPTQGIYANRTLNRAGSKTRSTQPLSDSTSKQNLVRNVSKEEMDSKGGRTTSATRKRITQNSC